MKLRKLIGEISGLDVRGSKEVEVTGIASHSALVKPGDLFIAKKGQSVDGSQFIGQAISSGAVAVLSDFYDPFHPVSQLIHPYPFAVEGALAAKFYDFPSKKLEVIGITGSKGKTTTSFLLHHILTKNGWPSGLIGTIEWIVAGHRFKSTHTTPDAITNQRLLSEMVASGAKGAIMEVSSHGLEQGRVEQIEFQFALLTNLYPDHLDYHGTFDRYIAAKGKLFSSLSSDTFAIFNADRSIPFETKGRRFTYGIENRADLMAKEIKFSARKSSFSLHYQGEEIAITSPLIGIFNVYNLLGAVAVSLLMGISLQMCREALQSFEGVKGRMEEVNNRLGIKIFVDFAHTAEALSQVLKTLAEIRTGRIIVVFGAGGQRDERRRRGMGQAAAKWSDEAIITNDNSRNEDPKSIADQILEAFPTGFSVSVELNREKAIEKAIEIAKKGDMIVIAGRGHETELISARQISLFDDVEVARKLCREREKR